MPRKRTTRTEPKAPVLTAEMDALRPETPHFQLEGRTMVCTVCGTEARRDPGGELYCPNVANHDFVS